MAEPRQDPLNPDYYTRGDIEVFQAIRSWGFGRGYAIGNIIKYVVRAGHKGGALQDLEKARWYLDELIKEERGGNDESGGETA